MSEYFKEQKMIKLSQYLMSGVSKETERLIKYLMSILGDVEVSTDYMDCYIQLTTCGTITRYDVTMEEDTIKGVYDLCKKYPQFSFSAIYSLALSYIKDLFEGYKLDTVLDEYVKKYGQTDEMFDSFMEYTDRKADELQKEYEEEAKKLDKYIPEYYMLDINKSYQYITVLKSAVVRRHIPVDSIISSLASSELVKKDARHLNDLAYKHRIYFSVGYPVSYLMTIAHAKGGDLKEYGQRPIYYITGRKAQEEATFTTQEFIDSIKETKKKTLKID